MINLVHEDYLGTQFNQIPENYKSGQFNIWDL